MPHGKGIRCEGFLSEDGEYAHCARPELAGAIDEGPDRMFAHRLKGSCGCGTEHHPADFDPRRAIDLDAARRRRRKLPAPDKEYTYCTPDRDPIAVKGRWQRADGNKDIRWRAYNGSYEEEEPLKSHGLAIETMPLYWADRIAKLQPGATIWLVEGEKAADACESIGLVDWKKSGVTTLPGGAHQREFGDALDLLHGHHIMAWHDNDAEGRKLMRHIKAKVEPFVLSWKPVIVDVPAHGDAADYFYPTDGREPGTLEGLQNAHLQKPACEVVDDETIRVRMPTIAGPIVVFTFSELERRRRILSSVVQTQLLGPHHTGRSVQFDIDVMSTSRVDAYQRMLQMAFPELVEEKRGDRVWANLLTDALAMLHETYGQIGELNDSGETADNDDSEVAFAVDGLVPLNEHTILFGRHDSTKSYIAKSICAHAALGLDWCGRKTRATGAWLYLDNETSFRNWKRRMRRIWEGLADTPEFQAATKNGEEYPKGLVYYKHMRGKPLYDMVDSLVPLIRQYGIVGVVTDSILMACRGDPKDPDVAVEYCRAVDKLGVTCISIGHVPKNAKEEPQDPFGSVVFAAKSRATLKVKRETMNPYAQRVNVVIRPTKGNDIEDKTPFFVQTSFDGRSGPVVVETLQHGDVPRELRSEQRLHTRIWDALQAAALTDRQVADRTYSQEEHGSFAQHQSRVKTWLREHLSEEGPLPRIVKLPPAEGAKEVRYARAAVDYLPFTPRAVDDDDDDDAPAPAEAARKVVGGEPLAHRLVLPEVDPGLPF